MKVTPLSGYRITGLGLTARRTLCLQLESLVAVARHRAGPWRQAAAAYLIASQDSARGRDQALGGPRRRNAQVHRRPGQGHDRLRHAGDLRRPVRANYRHKPDWRSGDIDKGKIKVIYTGDATDDAKIRKHVRRPSQNKVIQQRAKNPDDEPDELSGRVALRRSVSATDGSLSGSPRPTARAGLGGCRTSLMRIGRRS
jgi:hypothetical protein